MKRHNISDHGVIAHSDIAPGRKQDPGEKFPWAQLADASIGTWPDVKTKDKRVLLDTRDTGTKHIRAVQGALGYLGYGIKVNGILDTTTKLVVEAFQRRYRPQKSTVSWM